MKTFTVLRLAAAAAALIAGAAQAAEMTIYGRQGFEGRSHTLRGNANLADIGFDNRVSSLIVHSGVWEVCTNRDLRGRCVVLRPGRYAELDRRLDDRIESMRVLDRHALRELDRREYDYAERDRRYPPAERDRPFAAPVGHGVEMWSQPNFEGQHLRVRGETVDLVPFGMQDRASSVVVHDGRWEFCTEPYFRGECVILQRGTYPTLEPSIHQRVESVRQVEGGDYYGQRR